MLQTKLRYLRLDNIHTVIRKVRSHIRISIQEQFELWQYNRNRNMQIRLYIRIIHLSLTTNVSVNTEAIGIVKLAFNRIRPISI